MGLVSNIYAGPVSAMRSNGNSRSLAKKNAGSKGSIFTSSASFMPSDRKRKPGSGLGKNISYATNVLTREGWLSGFVVRENKYGTFVRVQGHEIKVIQWDKDKPTDKNGEFYIQKGLTVGGCKSSSNHPCSADYHAHQ